MYGNLVYSKRRIIPARAGFTRAWQRSPSAQQDHPRSRGVYRRVISEMCMNRGSSPLARGLRMLVWVGGVRSGIIPARAGFTGRGTAAATPSSDHPRSRGVYAYARVRADRRGGSSPLARGLRGATHPGGAPSWIIPARAGFTQGCTGCSVYTRDHPRSRGVYRDRVPHYLLLVGSSPLARGLLCG